MLPLNNPYKVTETPVSFVKNASQFENGRPYEKYFGGVTGISKKDFLDVNGYYNDFWGYGAEDDHFVYKLEREGKTWQILDGEFKSLDHKPNSGSEAHNTNANLFNNQKENLNEGVKQTLYELLEINTKGRVKHIKVNTKPVVTAIYQNQQLKKP
jgi:beta-1,4-galactosyltransferase 2